MNKERRILKNKRRRPIDRCYAEWLDKTVDVLPIYIKLTLNRVVVGKIHPERVTPLLI